MTWAQWIMQQFQIQQMLPASPLRRALDLAYEEFLEDLTEALGHV